MDWHKIMGRKEYGIMEIYKFDNNINKTNNNLNK